MSIIKPERMDILRKGALLKEVDEDICVVIFVLAIMALYIVIVG